MGSLQAGKPGGREARVPRLLHTGSASHHIGPLGEKRTSDAYHFQKASSYVTGQGGCITGESVIPPTLPHAHSQAGSQRHADTSLSVHMALNLQAAPLKRGMSQLFGC